MSALHRNFASVACVFWIVFAFVTLVVGSPPAYFAAGLVLSGVWSAAIWISAQGTREAEARAVAMLEAAGKKVVAEYERSVAAVQQREAARRGEQ